MDFARAQLQKYGWEQGKGLGKDETGRKECIKAKLKMDKTGIGHDVSKEYTNHWWDNVFNKTASSIQITSTQDGVELVKSSKQEKEISKDLQTYSRKAMKYGNFVKKATLTNGCEKDEENVPEPKEVESSCLEQKYCLLPGQEDEIFSKCGGRTAHKGARHGLKLNGKLLRIQEQEQILLDKSLSEETNQNGCDIVEDNLMNNSGGKKRKKKKKKSKDFKEYMETEPHDKHKDVKNFQKRKKQKFCDNLVTDDELSYQFDSSKSKGERDKCEANINCKDLENNVVKESASIDTDFQLIQKKKKKKRKKERN